MASNLTASLSNILTPMKTRIATSQARRQTAKEEKWKQKTEKAWNDRLPPSPWSSSNPNLFDDNAGQGAIASQLQSSFFGKFPLEIREIIYEFALGGEELLIRVGNGFHTQREKDTFKFVCEDGRRRFGLAQVCRLAYIEATPYIYSRNTCIFGSITSFFTFSRITRAPLFNRIRFVVMQWCFSSWSVLPGAMPPNCLAFWATTCKSIARMPGLREVRIDILSADLVVNAMGEEAVFAPVAPLIGKVRVRTSWPEHESVMHVGRDWEFEIERGAFRWSREFGGYEDGGWHPPTEVRIVLG